MWRLLKAEINYYSILLIASFIGLLAMVLILNAFEPRRGIPFYEVDYGIWFLLPHTIIFYIWFFSEMFYLDKEEKRGHRMKMTLPLTRDEIAYASTLFPIILWFLYAVLLLLSNALLASGIKRVLVKSPEIPFNPIGSSIILGCLVLSLWLRLLTEPLGRILILGMGIAALVSLPLLNYLNDEIQIYDLITYFWQF